MCYILLVIVSQRLGSPMQRSPHLWVCVLGGCVSQSRTAGLCTGFVETRNVQLVELVPVSQVLLLLLWVSVGPRARGAALQRGALAGHRRGAGRGVVRATAAAPALSRPRHRARRRGLPRLRLLQAE